MILLPNVKKCQFNSLKSPTAKRVITFWVIILHREQKAPYEAFFAEFEILIQYQSNWIIVPSICITENKPLEF